MVTLSLSFLGPFLATLNNQPLTRFRSKTAQALLIYLACQPEHVHRREHLMALLWPDLPQKSAQANLRQNLYRLRQAIPDLPAKDGRDAVVSLLADQQTVQINPAGCYELDLLTFGQLLKKGRKHWPEAVTLYRGDFLSDFFLPDSAEFEAWVLAWRANLRRQVLEVLDALTTLAIEQGDYQSGELYARHQLTIDNLRENAHLQLMENLARSGRRTEALNHYDALQQLLQVELGIEPSNEVMSLHGQIQAGELAKTAAPAVAAGTDVPSRERAATGIATEASRPESNKAVATPELGLPHNLPVQATPFIGREVELAHLDDLLADPASRLITVTGLGGVGKTRLVLAAAEQQLRAMRDGGLRFLDGIFFVSLASLGQAEYIESALAEVLGLQLGKGDQRSPRQQLLEFLSQKQLLLIMDNYEHLLAGTDLLADALQAAPALQILVTSRERLQLHGEYIYPIQGLEGPYVEGLEAVETAAIQLFFQAARRVRPDFELRDRQDLDHLIRICQQVASSPLGLELAASWTDVLSLADITAEIQHSLDFLETKMRNIPKRHRSLRAIFDTSWQKLDASGQNAFAQLSIFQGGFIRDAAQAVTGTTYRDLAQLVAKSLLQYDRASERYQFHELLRQFGVEKLAEDGEEEMVVRDRHSAHYCAFLQQQWKALKGQHLQTAATTIRADLDNCRVAWEWAVKRRDIGQLAQALDGLGHYMLFWAYRYEEAALLLKRVAEQMAGSELIEALQLLIRVIGWQASFSDALGQREQADLQSQRGLALLNQPPISQLESWPARAFVLHQLAIIIHFTDRAKARQLLEESWVLFQAAGDQWGEAGALSFLAVLTQTLGDFAASERMIKECLAIHRELGNQVGIAEELYLLAKNLECQNRTEEAENMLQESLTINRELDNRFGEAQTLIRVGTNQSLLGRHSQALAAYDKSLELLGERGHSYFIVFTRVYSSQAHLHLGQYEKARAKGEQALVLGQQIGKEYPMALALGTLGRVALARADFLAAHSVLRESTQSLRTYGRTGMPPDLAFALGVSCLALLGLGRTDEAVRQLSEAVTLAQRTGYVRAGFMALAAAALLFVKQGDLERGVELYAVAESHPYVANSCWFEVVCGQPIAIAATALPPEVAKSVRRRGRPFSWQETLSELAQELSQLSLRQRPEKS